jgi:hypothetical protein
MPAGSRALAPVALERIAGYGVRTIIIAADRNRKSVEAGRRIKGGGVRSRLPAQ